MNIDIKQIEKAHQSIKPYIRKTPLVYNDYLSQKYQKEVVETYQNYYDEIVYPNEEMRNNNFNNNNKYVFSLK
jgi:hypothetical protein